MRSIHVSLLMLVLSLFLVSHASPLQSSTGLRIGGPHKDIQLTRSTESGIEFVLQLDVGKAYTTEQGELMLNLPGVFDDTEPLRVLHIALPPGCDAQVRILKQSSIAVPGAVYACPFQGRNPHPLVEKRIVQIGDLRALRLDLNLLRTNSGSSRLVQSLRVEVDFVARVAQTSGTYSRLSKSEQHSQFLNGYQIGAWAMARNLRRTSAPQWDGDTWLRIPIKAEGLYLIDAEMLAALGLETSSLDPSNFKLYSYGGRVIDNDPMSDRAQQYAPNEIPMIRELDASPGFSDTERLLFYAYGDQAYYHLSDGTLDAETHQYCDTNYYYLLAGGALPGRSMQVLGMSSGTDVQYLDECYWRTVIQERKSYTGTDPSMCFGDELQGMGRVEVEILCPSVIQGPLQLIPRFNCELNAHSQLVQFDIDGVPLGEPVHAIPSATLEYLCSLSPGVHRLGLRLVSGTGDRVSVKKLTLGYMTPPAFIGGELHFESPDEPGVYHYSISDYSADAYVLDVTDFDSISVIQSSQFVDRVEPILANSRLGRVRRYFGARENALRRPEGISLDAMPDLFRDLGSSQLLVLAPESLLESLQPLIDFKNNRTSTSARMVSLESILCSFNCGITDPGAVRNFLLQEARADTPARYVLLVGNTHYDYRGLLNDALPLVFPAWFSGSVMYDEFFGKVDESELIRFAIGRLPVSSASDAQTCVEKIISYESGEYTGDWHNHLVFVADDEHREDYTASVGEYRHSRDTESLIANCVPASFDVQRLYSIEYPSVYNPEIRVHEKPLLEQELLSAINAGAVLINYTGHANINTWSHEYILHQSKHLSRITTNNHPAMYMALACEWAEIAQPAGRTMSQELMCKPNAGAIAVVAGAAPTNGPNNFNMAVPLYSQLFRSRDTDEEQITLAEALRYAKNENIFDSNRSKYLYLGDPSLRPAFPAGGGRVTQILTGGTESDTLLTTDLAVIQALTSSASSGQAVCSGISQVVIREAPVQREYIFDQPDGGAGENSVLFNYSKTGPLLYRGQLPVQDQCITAQFIVPKDFSGMAGNGQIRMYYKSDDPDHADQDGVVYSDAFTVDFHPNPRSDTQAPGIAVYFNGPQWRPEDWIAPNSSLIVQISDSSGINITGEIGHRIELVLDGAQPIDLTPDFVYDEGSWTSGSISRQLPVVESGYHELRLRAFDSFNNVGYAESEFYVVEEGPIALGSVVNFPNPVKAQTQFTFCVDGVVPEAMNEVIVSVYTLRGRRVARCSLDVYGSGALYFTQDWTPRNDHGDTLARGIYLYRLEVRLPGFTYSLLDSYGNAQVQQVDAHNLCGVGRMIVE